MDYETAQDVFRQAVLEAMDSAARDIFRDVKAAARNDVGAQDRDLPKIFPTIDAQLDRLIVRYGATWLFPHFPRAPLVSDEQDRIAKQSA